MQLDKGKTLTASASSEGLRSLVTGNDAPERGDIVRPTLTVLSPAQIAQVHDASLRILETTGVRVDSEAGRRLFARATGRAPGDDVHARMARVRIPRDLVEWAIEQAPAAVDVYDRQGELAFHLPGPARFGIGVTALYYQDPLTDAVTPFTRKHMEVMVRLGSALPNFDVISTVGIVQDVPVEVSDLYATLEMVSNTTKPLVLLVSDEDAFRPVLDLLEHLHGDPSSPSGQGLATRPFVLPYFNPISPLVINQGTADKMQLAIERGLPFLYSNYGMAGASTPITPAGMLVLLNAELLAGLVLSQLMKEGTPLILGSLPAYFDMKGMGSFYDVQSYLVNLACAEMMAHYGLPHCGTSGSGMGWGADLIAAGHQWLNHLLSCLGQVGLAPFVGDNLDSKAFSPAIAVLADEVIAQARSLAAGFALDDAACDASIDGGTIALEEIARVGPGGSYLLTDSTLKLFRRAYHHSAIFPKLTLEEWQARNNPRAEDLLRRHTRQLLDTAVPPDDHDELLARGGAFIREHAGRL
jgi:trimethylamine--corrinoid protein Co-methyltransferase